MKGRDINVPQDYIDIIKNARENPFPYKVRFDDLLPHTFFLNYEAHQDIRSIRPGSKTSDPTVTDVRQLRYTPDGSISYKLTYDINDNFQELPAIRRLVKPSDPEYDHPNYLQLYQQPIPLTYQKWKHLQELKCTIPNFFHSYYDELPHYPAPNVAVANPAPSSSNMPNASNANPAPVIASTSSNIPNVRIALKVKKTENSKTSKGKQEEEVKSKEVRRITKGKRKIEENSKNEDVPTKRKQKKMSNMNKYQRLL